MPLHAFPDTKEKIKGHVALYLIGLISFVVVFLSELGFLIFQFYIALVVFSLLNNNYKKVCEVKLFSLKKSEGVIDTQ